MKSITRSIMILVAIFYSTSAFTQNISLEWAKTIGNTLGIEDSKTITTDINGNIYIAGVFRDTLDFNPGTGVYNLVSQKTNANVSTTDIFIAKYDANGSLIWARSIGSNTDNDNCSSIEVINNSLIICGSYRGTAQFGTNPSDTLSSFGGTDGFIAKFDTSGDFGWARTIGGPSNNDNVMDFTFDNNNNYYITGNYIGEISFEGGSTTTLIHPGSRAFFAKYSSNGNFLWAKDIGPTGATGHAQGISLASDALNNVYLAGNFSNQIDIDPSANNVFLNSNGGNDFFISKYNSNGNFIWAEAFGGSGAESVSKIVYKNGKLYTIGTFRGTVDFDPGTNVSTLIASTTAYDDIFIAKYDTAGNYFWVNQISGTRQKGMRDLAFSANSEYFYVAGFFADTAKITSNSNIFQFTTSGTFIRNPMIVKYDTLGNYLWGGAFSSDLNSFGNGIATSGNGEIYTTGSFIGTIDFDPSSSTSVASSVNASQDLFITKLFDGCPAYTNINEIACDSFVFGGITLYTSGIYSNTIPRPNNCDSIVILNLTLKQTTHAPIVTGEYCDSTVINGISYYTTGLYTQIIANAAGCDSILTYDITIKGQSQQITLNETSCEDYVFNGNSYNTSGTYVATLQSISGCDSIVTLNLVIEPGITASIIQNGAALIANGGDSYQWINCADQSEITGATSQQYTVTANGIYAVIITAGSCSDTSDCIEITGLSIRGKLGNDNQIIAFPNPAKEKVSITAIQDLRNANIKLINQLGQELKVLTNQNGHSFEIDLSQYASGVYILEVTEAQEKAIIKIIKN